MSGPCSAFEIASSVPSADEQAGVRDPSLDTRPDARDQSLGRGARRQPVHGAEQADDRFGGRRLQRVQRDVEGERDHGVVRPGVDLPRSRQQSLADDADLPGPAQEPRRRALHLHQGLALTPPAQPAPLPVDDLELVDVEQRARRPRPSHPLHSCSRCSTSYPLASCRASAVGQAVRVPRLAERPPQAAPLAQRHRPHRQRKDVELQVAPAVHGPEHGPGLAHTRFRLGGSDQTLHLDPALEQTGDEHVQSARRGLAEWVRHGRTDDHYPHARRLTEASRSPARDAPRSARCPGR